MKPFKNWIVIAGNGRNTGKTTLACQIIACNRDAGVTGVKISPHHHPLNRPGRYCDTGRKLHSLPGKKEMNSKDSSRMLQAGASEVFYIQCSDQSLPEMFVHLEKLTTGKPVVCESGGMRKLIVPAVFIMALSENNKNKPDADANLRLADMVADTRSC